MPSEEDRSAKNSHLDRCIKDVRTTEPKQYKGEDTDREFRKSLGHDAELYGKQKLTTDKQLINSDLRAVTRLREAGHSYDEIHRSSQKEGLAVQGVNDPALKKEYADFLTQTIKETKSAQNKIQESQTLRAKHGLSDDKRIQTSDVARRRDKIANQKTPQEMRDTIPEKSITTSDVLRSNYKSRETDPNPSIRTEGVLKRNTQLARCHLDQGKSDASIAKSVSGTCPEIANRCYSPKIRAENGNAAVANARNTNIPNERPENSRYIAHESKWRQETQQAQSYARSQQATQKQGR